MVYGCSTWNLMPPYLGTYVPRLKEQAVRNNDPDYVYSVASGFTCLVSGLISDCNAAHKKYLRFPSGYGTA